MLEKLTYKNSINEVLEFGACGLYANKNDLRDFAWDIQSKNNKIVGFNRKIIKKSLPFVIAGFDTELEAITMKNKLYEICEKDVLSVTSGKLIINEYYMPCYITGIKLAEYIPHKSVMRGTLSIQTDSAFWYKETTTTFGYGDQTRGGNLDYNNDFAYDYTSNLQGSQLNNTGFVPSNFIMRIYGQANNPKVTVAGHDYEVTEGLLQNEYLEINSLKKTIYKITANGEKVNCFNKRNKTSYIFQNMPVGLSNVSNNGIYKFSITLCEERSMPKWT